MDYSLIDTYGGYGASSSSSMGSSVVSLVFSILLIIGMWKIFVKAGEKGWKSLIPIYGTYILWKLAGLNFIKVFLIFIGLYILSLVLAMLAAQVSFLGILGLVLMFAAIIYLLVEECKFCSNLSKCFGHGTGFAVGLFFLQPIFIMILGFNGDQYQGPQTAPKAE